MQKIQGTISPLTCDACVKLTTLLIKKNPHVINVSVDLQTKIVDMEMDNLNEIENVKKILSEKGYTLTLNTI